MVTWLPAPVPVLEAGKSLPVTVKLVFARPDAGSKLMLGFLIAIWVVCITPWSSTALMVTGPPATTSGVTGRMIEAVQLPLASKLMG